MKNKIYYIYTIFSLCCGILYGQNLDSLQVKFRATVPYEKADIIVNKDVFLAGEILNYKYYSLLKENSKISELSKIAYVELIGAQKVSIFAHKLKLQNGQGTGDFFIPADLKTGHYKLLGYTQWMQNNNSKKYIQKDIYVINPYVSETAQVTEEPVNKRQLSVNISLRNKEDKNEDEGVGAVFNILNEKYKTRSKVVLGLPSSLGKGNYVVSVNKVKAISLDLKGTTPSTEDSASKGFYLPELRGEIISGKVYFKDSGLKAVNKTVALSIPGENFIYKNVKVNTEGEFYFNIHEDYRNKTCLLQVMDPSPENFRIELDNKTFKELEELNFRKVNLNPNIKEWMETESTQNQIENAYGYLKLDSILVKTKKHIFSGNPTITYKLDDYKRFPTMRETFIEVIEGAGVRRKGDVYNFVVFSYDNTGSIQLKEYQPLVLLDGLLIQDNQFLLEYDPYKIEQISLTRGGYFYGPQIFYGIIDVKTKKANENEALDVMQKDGVVNVELNLRNKNKLYYSPNYGINSAYLKRIPDFRSQLLWEPNLSYSNKIKPLEFYTSDVEGLFQVSIKGYSDTGNYIEMNDYFEVKN